MSIQNDVLMQKAQVEKARQTFNEVYKKYVKREGSDALLQWLTDSDYFYAPASTRYHGAFEGGLIVHSVNVYNCLLKELKNEELPRRYSDETIAITALLHDACKVNFYKKGTRNVKENDVWVKKDVFEIDELFPCGHGEKSVILLQQFIKLQPEEILAIRGHMGGWDTSVKGGDYFIGKIFEKSKLAFLLHVADMKATYLLEG